jgi:proline racemase
VTFRNVPGWASHVDARLEVPGVGTLRVDVSYGGNHFVYFDAGEAGIELGVTDIERVISVALAVKQAANAALPIRDPVTGEARVVNIATVLGPATRPDATYRNVHVFGPRQFDRSPGGTGTTARLAALHARGAIALGGTIAIESLTGGLFRGRLLETVALGDRTGVVTEVTGCAHVTGFNQFVAGDGDRLREGFLVR